MALLSEDELKAYLRVQTTAENALVTRLLTEAKAFLETSVRAPLTDRPFGVVGQSFPTVTSVRSPNEGVAVASASLSISPINSHPDYAGRIEPLVNSILQDLVADEYQRRSPGATSESEAGVSISWSEDELPPRTRRKFRLLRRELVHRSFS